MAERQHGYVTRQQLRACGLSARAIDARLARGVLIAEHAGVYAIGHRPRSPIARAHAAVLACGDGAALSHASALAHWGLGQWPTTHEVTSPTRHQRPNIRTHRSQTLVGDVWTHAGIRTTGPVRTIVHVAPRLTDRRLTRLVNDARRRKVIPAAKLRQLLLRCPRLKRLIDPTQNPTRSGLEDDCVVWLKHHRLPIPRINVVVNDHEVDAYYEQQRLVVELDDWLYHGDRDTFNLDHHRDADHRAVGIDTIRYTGELLTDAEAGSLRTMLRSRARAC